MLDKPKKYEYPKFVRRELWLTHFKENVDYNHKNFAIDATESRPNENGEQEQMLAMSTPTAINLKVNTDKELIRIDINTKFILQNPQKPDIEQLAYEVGIAQTFRVINFKEQFYKVEKDLFVVPKEFASELIYNTFIASIGMIASLPKKKTISKFNLHYAESWKDTMQEDIECTEEDFFE